MWRGIRPNSCATGTRLSPCLDPLLARRLLQHVFVWMRMDCPRKPSHAELAFEALRALMLGHQLWGQQSGWCLAELAAFLRTDDARCCAVVDYLRAQGWVEVDYVAATARLTNAGARRFLATGGRERLTQTSPTVGGVC
jgi:hypothetical protein